MDLNCLFTVEELNKLEADSKLLEVLLEMLCEASASITPAADMRNVWIEFDDLEISEKAATPRAALEAAVAKFKELKK